LQQDPGDRIVGCEFGDDGCDVCLAGVCFKVSVQVRDAGLDG
jgi:hypothetical protein